MTTPHARPSSNPPTDPTEAWLVIARHGKAERDSDSGLDRDRALRKRGRRQAVWLGEELLTLGFAKATVISSEATRARQTAEDMAVPLGIAVEFDSRLFVDEPASGAIDLISDLMHPGGRLVLVGHNPQVSRLVSIVTGGVTAAGVGLRTGEAAIVRFHADGMIGSGLLDRVLRMPDPDDED